MNTNWLWIIKVVGVYEIVAGLLIMYGDKLGAILALGEKLVVTVALNYKLIGKGIAIAHENHVDLSHIPILVGIGLVLLAKYTNKKEESESDDEQK